MEDWGIKSCSGYDSKKKICKHGHEVRFGSVVCHGVSTKVNNKKLLTPECVKED